MEDLRFILTCVGTTSRCREPVLKPPVHPHMRGDHYAKASRRFPAGGSSSHAWGPLQQSELIQNYPRFILTCVGTTIHQVFAIAHNTVHPHMRGDHYVVGIVRCGASGSSSHAWGPLGISYLVFRTWRFILTCVGTTCLPLSTLACYPVHPHMRGDHDARYATSSFQRGSSSHAWGPRRKVRNFIIPARFILTCVGTTAVNVHKYL